MLQFSERLDPVKRCAEGVNVLLLICSRTAPAASRAPGPAFMPGVDGGFEEALDFTELEQRSLRISNMKTDLEAGGFSAAIHCHDVCRSYGRLKVLNNLNLTVPKGQIYGLLGPSGCGKTTLLKCIVGTLKISHGHITVLGKPPAFPGHEVPGKMVGYMPQDIALYNEFTISNTLWFYGRIHGLSSEEREARMNFLIEFLDLPQKNSLVKNLSGGQRRRVSLGAALLQNPRLLILDEPTVGVDPVLRANVFEVGLMRNGRLLAEGPPDAVMKQHNAATLETAFLQLCEDSDQVDAKQSPHGHVLDSSPSPDSMKDESREPILKKSTTADLPKFKADWKVRARHLIPKWRNIAALMIKTLVRMRRMPGSICFQFLLPVIQICLMCLCIGGDPKDIDVAVVNNESSPSAFSVSLLSFLDNTSVHQVGLSRAEAFSGILNGEYWGIIEFGENFTSYLTKRLLQPRVSREVVEGGSVHVWLDLTNRQIALMLQKKLHEAFEAFIETKLGSLSYTVAVPIKFEEPVFGSKNTDFTTFVTPGAVLSITFYLAVGLTALSFVLERKEGLLDRCWVAGVSSLETMLAHLFSQLFVISVQIVLLLIFILLVFNIPNEGSLALVISLIVLQGVTGISFGVIWPVECIPYPLRYLSLVLPQTYASEALRCIMYRGWGLSQMMVWRGFAVTLGWNTFFLTLATIILKLRT
ncbi:hypothetical protein DNTS_035375 [Danionella cerebrum]|uniref:ABC transporter domain-containing protein n=1 Tax=Danionella cerebrum TaxID=2873325 RepID=A0A553Q1N3_9TELE|nr:hypothetical protein DNTS_035375 [Danionella translucida]